MGKKAKSNNYNLYFLIAINLVLLGLALIISILLVVGGVVVIALEYMGDLVYLGIALLVIGIVYITLSIMASISSFVIFFVVKTLRNRMNK
jgi:hypothetical protein